MQGWDDILSRANICLSGSFQVQFQLSSFTVAGAFWKHAGGHFDLVYTRLDLPANQTPENIAMEICSAASGTTLAVLEDVEGQTTKAVKQRLAIDLGISRFRQRMLSTHMGIPF